ncbi:MAG: M48 family metallopeptidase [Pseudomonadota bacterium]
MRSISAARSDVPTGRFYDGEGGLRLDVEVEVDRAAGTLILRHADLPDGAQYWPLGAMRALKDQARADQMVLTLADMEAVDAGLITTARLSITGRDAIRTIRGAAPNIDKRDVKAGTFRKIGIYAASAVGAVALMVFVILPGLADQLAPLIPIEREVRWGKAVVSQMGRFLGEGSSEELTCEGAEGLAALTRMEERLTGPEGLGYNIDITVFDIDMVNAFAAPGGQIVLTRGLISAAPGADAVAGVLAHEIAHVDNRDVTRNALRIAGSAGLLSMALGDFAGGAIVVGVTQMVIDNSYTREAEFAADAYALDMLGAADVSGEGFAAFFDVLSKREGRLGVKLPEYLSTHPDTPGRAQRARDYAAEQGATRPVLTEADWAALQKVCG